MVVVATETYSNRPLTGRAEVLVHEGRTVKSSSHAYIVFVEFVGNKRTVYISEIERYDARIDIARVYRRTERI